jgi:hypothetical protein
MKEPSKEEYGWQGRDGFDGESGWMLEGGEQAYYKALAEYRGEPLPEPKELPERRACATCGMGWPPYMFQLDDTHCNLCVKQAASLADDTLPF